MAERLKAPAWKASIRQKRIGGSNPPLSAILYINPHYKIFCFRVCYKNQVMKIWNFCTDMNFRCIYKTIEGRYLFYFISKAENQILYRNLKFFSYPDDH